MSGGEDVNPFADPNDINPFAAPSAVSNNSQPAQLDDYNPFEQQPTQTTLPPQQPVFVPQQTYTAPTPATIEPTRAEPPPLYGNKPFSGGYGPQDDTMRKRQEELEKKAAELDRKEQELKRMQGSGHAPNNFPPLPKFCCMEPCFYHDINVDIPMESQKTCKMFFYVWQFYVLALVYNFVCGLAGVCTSVDNGATLFGVSILYLVLFVPCSFVAWYRPIYKALKSDSSFNYMLFFFVFFFQILFTFVYAFGISQFGTSGWINGAGAIDSGKEAVGVMFLISGALFTILGICKVFLLRRVHTAYRRSGASLEKAQSEFASGVATNKAVQKAAADAVVSGVSSGTRYS